MCDIDTRLDGNKKVKPTKEKPKVLELSYENYIENNKNLSVYKLPELKSIAKQHNLYVTGNKPVLLDRIRRYFLAIENAIVIQKYFRGHMIRYSFRIRGPCFKNIAQCVNDSDGYTLEPLNEIPFERFITITDKQNFVYGFDVVSLATVYKKTNKIINPYTRERVDYQVLHQIMSLFKIVNIVFPDCVTDDERKQTQMNTIIPVNTCTPRSPRNRVVQRTSVTNNIYTQGQTLLMRKMQELRELPLSRRIEDLFIEIDLLGNYTSSRWFSILTKLQCFEFHRVLLYIWNRGDLPNETKRQICQLHDPFLNNLLPRENYINLTLEQAQETCINVMEQIIHGGVDDEYRKIGTMHVLSALTIVSVPARTNYIWLYESLLII